MFAVVEQGAKQYMVKVGDVLKIEKVENDVGSNLDFVNIVLVGNKGLQSAENAKVTGVILEHKKADKVIIFKKKRRHNYRRKRGHRQEMSVVRITNISL